MFFIKKDFPILRTNASVLAGKYRFLIIFVLPLAWVDCSNPSWFEFVWFQTDCLHSVDIA
jgi:hypothetical protein